MYIHIHTQENVVTIISIVQPNIYTITVTTKKSSNVIKEESGAIIFKVN